MCETLSELSHRFEEVMAATLQEKPTEKETFQVFLGNTNTIWSLSVTPPASKFLLHLWEKWTLQRVDVEDRMCRFNIESIQNTV